MKIMWIVDRLDGSQTRHFSEEGVEPVPGDGKIVDGIPIAVGSNVTTPMAGERDKHDLVVAAKEQEN